MSVNTAPAPTVEVAPLSERPGRLKRIISRVAFATACALGVPLGVAQTAQADTVQHVEGTFGMGLSVRGAPHTASSKLATLPEGSAFNVECWTDGEVVDGNKIWEKGNGQGVTGFVSDRYLNTGYYPTGEQLTARGIPECDQPSQTMPRVEERVLDVYNRQAAADYAEAHAKDTPPFAASCTQLVSRALWAAGVRETPEWNDGELNGQHYEVTGRPGPINAWRNTALVQYLLNTYPNSSSRELNFSQNSVPDAQEGDIIAYDWAGDGETDHLAMIVDKAPGEYPEVAEWSVYGGTRPTPYANRGWTRSEINNKWLQEVQPGVKATLIHLDTSRKVKIVVGNTG